MKRERAFVILTPAFPRHETEFNWVPSQQHFVRILKQSHPDLKVFVLSFIYPTGKMEYEWYGVEVITFNGIKYRKINRLLLWFAVWNKLKKIKSEYDLLGIFSFWCGECALIGSWFSKLNRVKHKIWICGQDARKKNRLVWYIWPKPNELLAMSEFLVQEFYKNHQVLPGYMVPNAIDPEMFPALKEETVRDIDILGVGSFHPLKQYELFIKIADQVRSKLPDVKIMLCGDGEDREQLETLIRSLGMEKNFEFTGELPHQKVLKLMQRSKILMHPSKYEGFGTSCIEALYAGAHVVSFTHPGMGNFFQWHRVGNEDEMKQKVLQLLTSESVSYDSQLLYSMKDSVGKVMQLFLNKS